MMRHSSYSGSVCLVTGAGSGIGRALAGALVQAGARSVCLADLDLERAQQAATSLGPAAWAARLDVTDADAFAALAREVQQRAGALDYLFNNAGVGLSGEVRDLTPGDWKRMIDVNLWGVIHGVQAVWPLFVAARRGVIVNTASGAGICPRPAMVPYAAAKHAVVGLTSSLAAEGAGLGISVHALCPGYIRTEIMQRAAFRGLSRDDLVGSIPIKPMSAEECARVALRSVARGRVIIPITRLAWLDWLLFRLAPELSIWLARLRARKFRAHRLPPAPPTPQAHAPD